MNHSRQTVSKESVYTPCLCLKGCTQKDAIALTDAGRLIDYGCRAVQSSVVIIVRIAAIDGGKYISVYTPACVCKAPPNKMLSPSQILAGLVDHRSGQYKQGRDYSGITAIR